MSRGALIVLSLFLSGCGIGVPQHHEFWAKDEATTGKIARVTRQVVCELGRGFSRLSDQKQSPWIDHWGALVTITFDTTEKTAFLPGATISRPLFPASVKFPGLDPSQFSQSFGISIGGEASGEAGNKGVVTFFATAANLKTAFNAYSQKEIRENRDPDCLNTTTSTGFLFSESELHLDQWLYSSASLQTLNIIDLPDKPTTDEKSSISQTIKFDVITAGSATPMWKLVRVSASDTSPFLRVSRERSQQIDIVLGPVDDKIAKTLKPAAQFQYNANLIRSALGQR